MSGKAYTGYMHDYMHATSCLSILTANKEMQYFYLLVYSYCTVCMYAPVVWYFVLGTHLLAVLWTRQKFIPDPIPVQRFQTIPDPDPNPD
jgi:hypothetical protein